MKELKEGDMPIVEKYGQLVYPLLFVFIALVNTILKFIPESAMHQVSWWITLLPLVLPLAVYLLLFIFALVTLIRK